MNSETTTLAIAALGVGVAHTLLGPDHYLPFIALARSRDWTARRTLAVTLVCGLGHVAGSILLGAVGLALGWALADLTWWESARGDLAGWLLLGFGFAYFAWGVRRALRNRPHSHVHAHEDGTVHRHEHRHLAEHAHPHEARGGPRLVAGATAWTLFLVFVLGPCEPLIPLLMYPAAGGNAAGVALVVALFAAGTLATMSLLVLAGRRGLVHLPHGPWERWAHAAAGLIIVACGVAIRLGL